MHPQISAIRFAVPLLAALAYGACDRQPAATPPPHPSAAVIAAAAAARIDTPPPPLSPTARLGQQMFFDPALSGSGKMSCATCHDPAHAYAPANALPVQLGGPALDRQGVRAVPTLTYLERTPRFVIRPDIRFDPDEGRLAKAPRPALNARPGGTRGQAAVQPAQSVPEGGMDWDGRASTLAEQAGGPLLDPREMANRDTLALLARLRAAPYAKAFAAVFGREALDLPEHGLADAYQALARFQIEDRSFHRYDSKFDYVLAGRAQLSAQELRGLALFDDPHKGNCAACHLDRPSKNRLAPVFTDYEFEALAAPRNAALAANRDPAYFDEGLCGPARADLTGRQDLCGLFKTPTLRNVATRQVFFHNGVFHSLKDVLRFYVERETRPEQWYPRRADGTVEKYDDLPPAHRANVDSGDAPFDRGAGDPPALDQQEIEDLIAFLETLTDGYRPAG